MGWLWVKPIDGAGGPSVFLEQITVAASCRRQGYGARDARGAGGAPRGGWSEELQLRVFVGNQAARRLYAAAGYEEVEPDERRVSLRKRLQPAGSR